MVDQERVNNAGQPSRTPDGDFDMRIDRDGTWHYQGTPINRLPLVKLFASVLRREPDGTFLLVTPVERGTIVVEDAPFVAVDVDRVPAGTGRNQDDEIIFRTNLGETVIAGPDHPLRVETDPDSLEPRPYVEVRDGLEARLSRAVFYRLVDMAEERAGPTGGEVEFGVWSKGRYFRLGTVDGDGIGS